MSFIFATYVLESLRNKYNDHEKLSFLKTEKLTILTSSMLEKLLINMLTSTRVAASEREKEEHAPKLIIHLLGSTFSYTQETQLIIASKSLRHVFYSNLRFVTQHFVGSELFWLSVG